MYSTATSVWKKRVRKKGEPLNYQEAYRAHFLDPCAVPLIIDELGSAQVALLWRVSASKWWTRGKLGPVAAAMNLES